MDELSSHLLSADSCRPVMRSLQEHTKNRQVACETYDR
jgi:hypothetical protein